jgi:hypothetical protein
MEQGVQNVISTVDTTGTSRRIALSPLDRLAARSEVSALPLHDELVLYDGRSGQTYVLNQTGAYVWNLCDGARTLQMIIRATAIAHGVDEWQASADVRTFVDELRRADLLVIAPV